MKEKNNRVQNWLIFIVILLGLLAFWCVFPIFFQWLIVTQFKINPKVYGETFGAVGDTYGSLNTLVSSLALSGVAYSAYLQVTSLKETRDATTKQLELAEKNHLEQIKESKYSNFTTIFYSLLNHKNNNYIKLSAKAKDGRLLNSDEIFIMISRKFVDINRDQWRIIPPELNIVRNELASLLVFKINNLFYSKLNSHFMIYSDLMFLIKKSILDKEDKDFFVRLVANSMTDQEQVSLIWFSAFNLKLKEDLCDSGLMQVEYSKYFIGFFMKFHNISLFSDQELIEEWKKIEETNQPQPKSG